jgi:hypothetical protein
LVYVVLSEIHETLVILANIELYLELGCVDGSMHTIAWKESMHVSDGWHVRVLLNASGWEMGV